MGGTEMSEEEKAIRKNINFTNELLKASNEINSDINTKLMWIAVMLAWIVFAVVFQLQPWWK